MTAVDEMTIKQCSQNCMCTVDLPLIRTFSTK